MRFLDTGLAGAFLLEPERREDERGFFARTWCAQDFAQQGLDPALAQCSASFNHRRGTLRGLHYQAPPFAEVKLVRCTRGALFDVALDLRPDSASFRKWIGVELTEDNGLALYIPRGFAHGYLTLAPGTEVDYQISIPYEPSAVRGVRWDDPFHGIAWPGPVEVIAARDRAYPDVDLDRLQDLKGL